MYFLKFNWNS